jgi:predicted RNA-binding Zn-ribbon protein involved in translation (DUF1610 family)
MNGPALACPHCNDAIIMRQLRHQGLFATHRICPHCGKAFTVDRDTRRRQAVCLAVALFSLVFSILLYTGIGAWLLPALLSYVVLAILIYHGNQRVRLVALPKDIKHDG